MRALQRLVVTGHWAAFIWGVFAIGIIFFHLVIENERLGKDGWVIIFAIFLPILAFAFVPWIFTGKFILWPWKRLLPSFGTIEVSLRRPSSREGGLIPR